MAPTVRSFADSASLASNLADYVISIQNHKLSSGGDTFTIGVSGGSLVKALRAGLQHNPAVKWDKWRIFFVDERLVPLDHDDSNYGLVKKELLDHLSTSKPQVFPIDESLIEDGAKSAQHYSQVIEQLAGTEVNGVPQFDLLLLGCGPDGHTCSLFPGHALLEESDKVVAYIDNSPKPPPRRVTITFPVIEHAKNVAFVAEGAGKAPILKEIFEQGNHLPSATVNAIAKPVWFVSDDAVRDIKL